MKRFAALLLCLLLLPVLPALAGDVVTVDVSTAQEITTDCDFLRLTCPGVEGNVRVTVTDDSGAMVYQKDYGMHSGTFRSDEIYLRLNGGMRYRVTLEAGDTAYTLDLWRRMPRMKGVSACSVGFPLSMVTGRDSWKSATLLDLDAMGSPVVMPLQAAGTYALGQAVFTLEDGQLTVHADLDSSADATLENAWVYVAANILDARRLDTRQFIGRTGPLDQPLDVRGNRYVIVYVHLTVSFDPAGAAPAPAVDQPGQQELLTLMNRYTINEEVG